VRKSPLDLSSHAIDFISSGQTLVVKNETESTFVSGRLSRPSGQGAPILAERI
jgi:hypothetical protein